MEWPALPLIFGLSKARRRSIPFMGLWVRSNAAQGKKRRNPSGGSRLGRLAAFLARYPATAGRTCASLVPCHPLQLASARTIPVFQQSPKAKSSHRQDWTPGRDLTNGSLCFCAPFFWRRPALRPCGTRASRLQLHPGARHSIISWCLNGNPCQRPQAARSRRGAWSEFENR